MSAVATTNLQEILTEIRPGESKVFYGVDWDDYIEFLEENVNQSELETTYNRGVLRANMVQGFTHENLSRFIEKLLTIAGLVLNKNIVSSGSMTLVSNKLHKGAEPDESYYIQNAHLASFKSKLFDDKTDTPPDLVVEIDESHKSDEKFEIYAAFGIKEFWLYDEEILRIFVLIKTGEYLIEEKSLALPVLSAKVLTEFLKRSQTEDQIKVLQDFQNWLQEQNK